MPEAFLEEAAGGKPPWKAIVYARVSTEEQAERGYSLEAQREDCLRRTKELGYSPDAVLVLSDEASGAQLDRPGLNRMRELVASGSGIEIVVVYDPDRLSRKLSHQLIVTEELVKGKITLEFVNFAWNNTPEGRMFYQLRGMFAEFEREKIRERTIRGRLAKLKHHGKLSLDPRLYGYRFDTEEDVLVPSSDEASRVQQIFRLAADGQSAAAIARQLQAEGCPAPRGTRWYGSTVSRILRNPSYLGTYSAYKVDYHLGYRHERPPEEQFPLPLVPLVDEALFAAAGRMLARKASSAARPGRAERLAAGRAICACGRRMTAAYAPGGGAYYRCPAGGRAGKGCGRYWNAAAVDALLWERVSTAAAREARHWLARGASTAVGGAQAAEAAELARRRDRLEERRERLLELYLADELERAAFRRKDAALAEDARRLGARLAELRAAATAPWAAEEAAQAVEAALAGADFALRRAVFELAVREVVFAAGSGLQLDIRYRLADSSQIASDGESHGGP
ncbi:recombinase family protein [Gorillibacterium sp. CAU 1737]|uniref:recombinase family protein n=1 Tax=Gorillibacterium sp. CAU 1737 TaxID=3140362 RepID=UPI0032610313